ncbi:MAG: hypothetical protein AB7J40_06025 [Candidatus Altimarinota bacterium]
MKDKCFHIGSAVLGIFMFLSPATSYAQLVPDDDQLVQLFPEEVSQIDAEETAENEQPHIRFSDVDQVTPAIQDSSSSQQSMSSWLVYDGSLIDLQYSSHLKEQSFQAQDAGREQGDQRNDRIQRNQQQQHEKYQYQNDQRDWDSNDGSICPNTDDERCFYPESQRKRCELFDGLYVDGVCYMRSDRDMDRESCENQGGLYMHQECYLEQGNNDRSRGLDREWCLDMGGQYRDGSCSIKYDEYEQYQRHSWSGGGEEDALVASIDSIVRTDMREACEDKAGEYLGNGKCVIPYYDQQKCDDKDGTFYRGECIMDTDDL